MVAGARRRRIGRGLDTHLEYVQVMGRSSHFEFDMTGKAGYSSRGVAKV
jgi:hypothetical protein